MFQKFKFVAVGAVMCAGLMGSGAALAQEAAKPEEKTTEVVVQGKKAPGADSANAPRRKLTLDRQRASSCNFMESSGTYADSYVEGYFTDLYGSSEMAAEALGYVSFSENAPYSSTSATPDGSQYFNTDPLPDSDQARSSCGLTDRASTAARARIARKDKTIFEAYALYDEEKYPEALARFKVAYEKVGYVEVAVMIGKMYLYGTGTEKDPAQAVAWLRKAAEARFDPMSDVPPFDPRHPDDMTSMAEASMILAKMHLIGFGVKKDIKAARKWFERAGYVGYVPARKTLGDIYYYGIDTPRDVKKAVEFYTKAAEVGYGPAQYALGSIYQYGEGDIAPNPKLALGWYQEAAKTQHPDALYELAVAYDRGEDIEGDSELALGFYKESATRGNADAQNAMATYFYAGEMVAKDLSMARKWFEQAAIGGQVDAMFNLGAMLARGEGGEADPVKAWVWFKIAQQSGHEQAGAALKALERKMTEAQKAEAMAYFTPKT